MSKITLTLPEFEQVKTGKQITFKTPCDCTGVTHIVIKGISYKLVDVCGNEIVSLSNVFSKDSMITVILDIEACKAFIQSTSNAITKICIDGTYYSLKTTTDDTVEGEDGVITFVLEE